MSWILRKQHRLTLSREAGCIRKAWGEGPAVCLVYPNTYRVGMSNLGFQAVYALFNQEPGCLCERAFLPDLPDREAPRTPSVLSLESQRPLAAFDAVAFSLSFENDYPQILRLLSWAGIPLLSAARREGDPLVLAGGIAVTLNPEPLAEIVDLFLLGEAEETLPELVRCLARCRQDRSPRHRCLSWIQGTVPGAYVPALYRVSRHPDGRIAEITPVLETIPFPVKKPRGPDLASFSTRQIVTAGDEDSEFGHLFLTEVSRGCSRGCRFCAAGFAYRPARFRAGRDLEACFRTGLSLRKKIGLLGTAVSDHPELPRLCRTILDAGGAFSLGSLRVDAVTDELACLAAEAGLTSLSLAPEAGTQRLRNVIRKGVTEENIFEAVETLGRRGIPHVRLYFLVGLPTETDEDAEAIVDLIRRLRHHALHRGSGRLPFPRLTLSLHQFIPKAATPFQWHPLEDVRVAAARMKRIVRGLRGVPAVYVVHDLPKWNWVQALFSLGDREVGKILLAAHRENGDWLRAVRCVNVHPDFYVYRRKEPDEVFPWDVLDHGIDRAVLLREYRKALAGT